MDFVLATLGDIEDSGELTLLRRYKSDHDFFPIGQITPEIVEVLEVSNLEFV